MFLSSFFNPTLNNLVKIQQFFGLNIMWHRHLWTKFNWKLSPFGKQSNWHIQEFFCYNFLYPPRILVARKPKFTLCASYLDRKACITIMFHFNKHIENIMQHYLCFLPSLPMHLCTSRHLWYHFHHYVVIGHSWHISQLNFYFFNHHKKIKTLKIILRTIKSLHAC